MSLRLPRSTVLPSTVHWTPRPGRASKVSASGIPTLASCAFFSMASASGCSEPFSAIAANFNTSFSVKAPKGFTSVTEGSPFVSVPVLSKTMVVSFRAFSTYSPLRRSTPYSAPLPTPARMAVGVAMPRVQGHAMRRTASNAKKAAANPVVMYQ